MSVTRFILILFCFKSFSLSAQIDSVFHSPRKATIYSAVLPGLGQAYNKKYWKIPIIYAGLATCVYFYQYNKKEYNKVNNAIIARLDTDSTTIDNTYPDPPYTDAYLQDQKTYFRKNKELSAVIGVLIYIANIIDADVDAHMMYFNVDDNLSLLVSPSMTFNRPGLSLCLNF